MTMANSPANSAAHVLETQTPNNPSASENSLPDPSMADPRYVKMEGNRAWIAEQERRIERMIIGAICSGKADSLKPNSGKAITVGEHYVCVSFHDDGLDPSYRTWEWHGHVMTPDGSNGYVPEHIYGNFLERVDAVGLYDEEDEEGTEDSDIPIVLGNVNLRLNRFN